MVRRTAGQQSAPASQIAAPEASTAVAERRKRLMNCCLAGFILGFIVSVLAVLGSLDLL